MSNQSLKLDDIANEARDLYEPSPEEHLQYIGLEHIEKQSLHLGGFGVSSDTQSTKKRFLAGDILFGTLRPYFRKVVRPSFDGVCSTDITVVRAKEGTDQEYLFYFIASPRFIDFASAGSNGTRMPRASWKRLIKTEWEFPDLGRQQKIASVLGAYDDLIENNLRRIKILEEMAQRLYREWFVHFRFPGHEKVGMIDSPLGKIPEGWEVRKLSAFVRPQYGYTESASDEPIGPKFLRGTDINKRSYIDWSTVPYCEISDSVSSKYKLRKGDVVIVRMADPGKVGIVERDIDAVFASYLVRLNTISEQLKPYYLFYFLLSDEYQNYITGASTGTTRKSASGGTITGIDLVMPDSSTQQAFQEKVSGIRSLLTMLLQENDNLRAQRDLVLEELIV